jgi:hypothetical protein
MTNETHAQFQARIRRERKAKNAEARAGLASYYAGGPADRLKEDYENGRYVTISIGANGERTVTNGPGL